MSRSRRPPTINRLFAQAQRTDAQDLAHWYVLARNGDGSAAGHGVIAAGDSRDGIDSRNFVLCPGHAYDRSPCGTGTSAKVACLAADGKLAPKARCGGRRASSAACSSELSPTRATALGDPDHHGPRAYHGRRATLFRRARSVRLGHSHGMSADALIVGAGIVGAACAAELAAHGCASTCWTRSASAAARRRRAWAIVVMNDSPANSR